MKSNWSNSSNGLLRYSVNRMNNSGLYFGPTQGLSSPKNSQRGCLCPHSDEYLRECCDGSLQAQGVGVIQSAFTNTGSFSDGFDDGFNNGSPL